MKTYRICKYNSNHYTEWNSFVSNASNATFLFYREFMEYHKDRFEDYSLCVYNDKNILIALLPANIDNDKLISHQGLTYGGLIISKDINFTEYSKIFETLLEYLSVNNIHFLLLKPIPKIYDQFVTDKFDSFTNILNAINPSKDISLATDLKNTIHFSKLRLRGVKKAIKAKLRIEECEDLTSFWNELLIPNLKTKFDTTPTHSIDEIKKLKNNFPRNIRQFNVYNNNTLVAGTTIFDTEYVAHSQYISGAEAYNHLGGLDFLFHHLITEVFKDKNYFNFGVSTANSEGQINEGLFRWKQGFDAKPVIHNTFLIKTENYKNLKNLFV